MKSCCINAILSDIQYSNQITANTLSESEMGNSTIKLFNPRTLSASLHLPLYHFLSELQDGYLNIVVVVAVVVVVVDVAINHKKINSYNYFTLLSSVIY